MDKHPQCHKKHTPRSEQLVKDVTTRLNRAIGQLNGVKQMVEEDRYCGDVLTQLAAAQSAVKAVSRMVLEDHLQSCVIEEVQQGNTKVISEVVDLLKKFS
ncbi:metal-sensing transcriptional repressor [Atopobium fossor]|uniref:metal-sensing transcriptional repressor n=1 Tax=Atopobium fossor TaxID=39487 RepID=UPI00042904B3|nr:metal-sensing transcriptional repressor [Atopobium fossor]